MNKLEWLTASGYKKMRREEREAEGYSPARFSPVLEDKEWGMSHVCGSILPQAQAHAELRPARFVVDPSHDGVSQLILRLRLSWLGDKCEQVAVQSPTAACAKPRPIPKRRRATEPKAQEERCHSLNARGDDVLNRSQFCVRASACGKTLELAEELEDIFNADAERLAAEVNSNTDRHNALERS